MTTSQRGPGATLPRRTYLAILEMLDESEAPVTAAQVFRELQQRKLAKGTTLRTVQRMLKAHHKDDSGPWSLAEADPEDAALVLPMLRWAVVHGKARPSAKVCGWIVRIRRIAGQDIEPEWVDRLARHAARGDVESVEEFLSYEPWTEPGGKALSAAFDAGKTSFGVTWVYGGIEPRKGQGR